jgi:regulator of cell morphogenesis and NO signaling
MKSTATKTVRELALENPAATRVFENMGIDYCCGGHKSLDEACASAKLNVDDVLSRLEQAQTQAAPGNAGQDWQKRSMTELVDHIVATHHAYIKEESPRLQNLLAKVVSVHGKNHPELERVQQIFSDLAQELAMHLMKEEQILFPYLANMEAAATRSSAMPSSCFGTVQNPIRMMLMEHDSAGDALRDLREVTKNYALPADACVSYSTLYNQFQEFERDLHQHIHLENNILFPHAIAMEGAA